MWCPRSLDEPVTVVRCVQNADDPVIPAPLVRNRQGTSLAEWEQREVSRPIEDLPRHDAMTQRNVVQPQIVGAWRRVSESVSGLSKCIK
jgi:hypothetical protein